MTTFGFQYPQAIEPPSPYLIVIAGPTAVGKTHLAIQLALMLGCEIVSADSRQFYREISIGTAKPSPEELQLVPHHFINSLSIHDEYNAGRFETEALALLNKLFEKQKAAILVGGSGLFIQAVLEGFDNLPTRDEALRSSLEQQIIEKGIITLQQQLLQLDPEHYAQADLQNPQRLIRALEVCISSGKPYSTLLKQHRKPRNFTPVKIGLDTDREQLYQRINHRVDLMMKAGLLEEAREVYPYKHLNSLQTVGYRELFDHFDGEISLERAVELIKQNTRRFAKRQLTWFRRDKDIHWFDPAHEHAIVQMVKDSLQIS